MVGGQCVLLLKGKLSRSGTGYWRFDSVEEGRSIGVMMSFRFGYEEVKNLAKRRLMISPKSRVELSYQWPQHMLMDDGRDAPPVVVANNDDLDLFLEMRSEAEVLNLCVTVLDEDEGGRVYLAEERADIALEALEMKKAKRVHDSLYDHGSNRSDASDSSDDDDSFLHEFTEQAEEQAKHDTAPSKTETTLTLWDKGKSVACDSEGDSDKEEVDEGKSSSQTFRGTSSRAILDGVHSDEEDFPVVFGMDAPPVVENIPEYGKKKFDI